MLNYTTAQPQPKPDSLGMAVCLDMTSNQVSATLVVPE